MSRVLVAFAKRGALNRFTPCVAYDALHFVVFYNRQETLH